ncbi:MAG: hypothetical protein ACRDG5_10720 [Anaerolineales bacterium]
MFRAAALSAIAASTWAALHDILKGEPDLGLEWAWVTAVLLGTAALGVRRVLRAMKR